jgi:hypothetical protein|tara:strand:- start:558 stop:746 length:189 start_codon:yes stop_codon:yes gene_type:complete
MTNLSSVDTTIVTVFKREILEIEARGINVSPVVLNYLSERVKNIESGQSHRIIKVNNYVKGN